MAIEITTRMEPHFLRVKATGIDDNLEEVKEYGLEVLKASLAFNCTKVLCDETELTYRLSTLDTYELAKFVSEYAPRIGRLAIVCMENQFRDAKFWETATVNRGLKVKVFKTLASAEEWLLDDRSD